LFFRVCMQSAPLVQKPVKWWAWVVVAGILVLVMAPWWRNHGYLRSFFDYGVVMGGIGRIDQGQRPYVDFISPIQTGWYVLNGLAEKAGGGTFQAMTLGGAACTLVSLAALMGLLARRWSLPLAAVVAGGLVAATASQHTLIWYNSWGVVLVAVAAWAGAMAPVLRRETWGWHLLLGVALFFGGINKINMQLMAVGLAMGWAVQAGLTGRATWGRVGATLTYYLGWAALPVGAEMIWTGASFATWWHNVIALPAASRSGLVLQAFSIDFLIRPFHDYYGPLLLRKGGLICAIATVLTVAAICRKTWREAGWWKKILPVAGGAVAVLGGVVLLTTNMDIIYIGVAGWLALLIALWLGYDLPARGGWFYGAIVAPVILVGSLAWCSAWEGQRSQFGHSAEPRSAYVDGAQAGPEFAYLKGTRVPPEMADSLQAMARWRQSLGEEKRRRHFFGPGTEWAARFWPAMWTPGLPIYVHPGNSLGSAEAARLLALVNSDEVEAITVSEVLDFWSLDVWPGRDRFYIIHRYLRRPVGGMFGVYERTRSRVSVAPVWFTRAFGGSVDARFLVSDASLEVRSDWHMFLGIREGHGEMKLTLPTNRLSGQVILRRVEGAPRIPVSAHFMIHAQENATTRFERWSHQLDLPAEQDEAVADYAIDSSHMPAIFTVDIPPAMVGTALAGWAGLRIQHTGGDGPDEPAWLYHSEAPITQLDEAALARLLPAGWRPEKAFMRNGRVTDAGVEFTGGGELWLRVRGVVTRYAGTAVATPQGDRPTVRGMWYNSGRLEVFSEMQVRANDLTADFHGWGGEPGGWLVIAVEPGQRVTTVTMRIHQVTHQDAH
jgi:hypothetical protein